MAKEKVISAILQLKDKNFSSGLRQGSSGVDKFRRGVYRASDGVDKFRRNAVSGFNRVGQASSSLTKTLVGVGSALLGLKAIGWAKDQVKNGLEAAASLESYRLTLDTVLKDREKARKKMLFASDMTQDTPFEDDEIYQGITKMEVYRLEAEKYAYKIGDMAAITGKSYLDAVEAIGDAQNGELERLKEFTLTKTDIQKKADAMFKKNTVINNKGQIVDQEKFNEAMFALMDERFKGGMEKQSKTLKGLMSTITGTWTTGLATMLGAEKDGSTRVGSVFDKIKKKSEEVIKVLNQWSKDGKFEEMGKKLADMADKFEDKLPAIKQFFVDLKTPMQVVGDILGKIGDGFKVIIDFVNEHPDIARNIGLTAAGAIVAKKTGVWSLGKGIVDVATKTLGGGGTQNIKAAVVNVFGAKVNGGGGIGIDDVTKAGAGGATGGSVLSRFWSKIKGAAKGSGGSIARELLSNKSLMMMAATDAYSGTTESSQELGANFIYEDMKKNGFNVIDPALNDKNFNLPINKRGYSTARYGADPQFLQELNILSSAIAQLNNKPSEMSFNLNGITVREEADIDKIVSKIVSQLKTMGMVTTSVTSFSGYSRGRR